MTFLHRPPVTLFHTDGCEWQTVAPIAEEAQRRGFPVRYSTNLRERAEIGIYCQHACTPNAALSLIMLHDLAQRHDIWPAFWHYEPWQAFDIGILPGEAWVQRWQSQAAQPAASPRLGVFNVGWPKADLIYRNQQEFAARSAELRRQLGLIHPHTVLYAPSWENHGKQDDFVQRLRDLPVNLLLKQAPWSDAYPQVLENIRQMNALHRGMADNIHVIDPNVSIMYCIGIADLLVSDESSVLIEAALHGVPSVAVTDWLIPDRQPPRPACVPFDHVRKIQRASLRGVVEALLQDPAAARSDALRLRDHHFSHFGQSSQLVVDLLEAALDGTPLPLPPLQRSQSQLDTDLLRYQQAEALFAANDEDAAVAVLQQLVDSGTECWQPYNDLGAVLFNRQQTEAALSLLQVAVQKEGTAGTALQNLAAIQCAAGLHEPAMANYARLLQAHPDDSNSRARLAALLAGSDASPARLQSCNEVVNLLCQR